MLCASLGTSYEMDTAGKILFIEEIGEHIGNLDRHIYQLRNAGKLKETSGILLGQFARCDTDEEAYTIIDVVLEATEGLDIPVMYNVQSGHDFPMITLPMGAGVRWILASDLSFFFLLYDNLRCFMKVYISADIEGVTGVTSWKETILGEEEHKKAAWQMTREVVSACESLLWLVAQSRFM